MTKRANSGLGLVGVLLIIGALVVTTGGVLVWRRQPILPQIVGLPDGERSAMTASLNEEVQLTPGQTVSIEGTNLSISLVKITPPPEGSFDYPTKAELEVRSGRQSEKVYFIAGVLATEEVAEELRHKEVFGFRITREMLNSEQIILTVQKL